MVSKGWRCPQGMNLLHSIIMRKKLRHNFWHNADFDNILVLEDHGKQNPNEFYTTRYQKHVACSYGYKLVCNNDTSRKPFKSYLGEYALMRIKSILTKILWWQKK